MGKTLIIVTHNLRVAQGAERVVYLRDGELFTEPMAE